MILRYWKISDAKLLLLSKLELPWISRLKKLWHRAFVVIKIIFVFQISIDANSNDGHPDWVHQRFPIDIFLFWKQSVKLSNSLLDSLFLHRGSCSGFVCLLSSVYLRDWKRELFTWRTTSMTCFCTIQSFGWYNVVTIRSWIESHAEVPELSSICWVASPLVRDLLKFWSC